MEEYLEFAKEIGEYAKRIILENFNKEKNILFKEDKTVVTTMDKDINNYLIKRVKETYPNHKVLGEEESFIKESKYAWVCDPIDGTGMFTNEIPVSVFSLALVIDGEPTIGIVVDPYLDKTYTAIKGQGAFCNGKRIQVNNKRIGEVGYRLNYEMWNESKYNVIRIVEKLLPYVRISSIGSVARSCMAIASGNFSCDLFPGTEHGNCDMAASYLIVTEAGGLITDFDGNSQRYDRGINGAVITNKISHNEILEFVEKYK